ncbi:hypothetical protein [Undibacterium flavidum]|uniref:Uncharacterized protein n=1 Tax=Undibacterium flavidum TaxID=2762297 RepID=A0ABR6Y691_9BURK|nr:hypothetical protein [Undibacterium flavidum]MBC3872129.1 hypothetical protein [Undibacterium flavidum]
MPRSNGQRLFSASLAIGISLFFLAQLHRDFLRTMIPTANPVARIMLLSFPVEKAAPKIIQSTPTTVSTSPSKRNKIKSEVAAVPQATAPKVDHNMKDNSATKPVTELVNVFPETPSSTANAKPVDPLSATARYKYDSASVKLAYEASKSDIQKLAEKSGTSLEDPKTSKHDRFQQAANRAAKPDCLRQGGSILSLFVVAYQVATDHCK